MKELGVEEWRDVPGFDGMYLVSSLGRVRSLPRVARNGQKVIGGLLAIYVDSRGYPSCTIKVDGVSRALRIHRLIAIAFLGPPLPGFEVAHEDGVATNSVLSNLTWKTEKENQHDRFRHGTSTRGTGHGLAKLSDDAVRRIRTAPGKQMAIAKFFGITQSNVSRIKNKKAWRHVE